MKPTKMAILAMFVALAAAAPVHADTFRLAWDPVTRYLDGAPLEPSKTVTYTAYWTTDSSMAPSSLKPVGSPTAGTSVDFDTVSQGMAKGKQVYFTCRAAVGTGESSNLSSGVSWVVPFSKPSPPRGTKIIRIK
jgi:hypothetical protein